MVPHLVCAQREIYVSFLLAFIFVSEKEQERERKSERERKKERKNLYSNASFCLQFPLQLTPKLSVTILCKVKKDV